ncbi:MAG: transposase [Planctomycetota bacterium]|jgi:transposase
MMSNIGERYGEFMAASGGPEEARRRIVECARRHGTMAAARMSGASRRTVRNLVIRADAGDDLARNAGRQPLSARDEARIVAAKRAHPDASARALRSKRGLPYGLKRILRVLGEAGMLRKRRRPTRDPGFWLPVHEFRLKMALLDSQVAVLGVRPADLERPDRLGRYLRSLRKLVRARIRLGRAGAKVRWWKRKREVERSPRNAIMTSAVDVGRSSQPSPLHPDPAPDPDPVAAAVAEVDAAIVRLVLGLAERAGRDKREGR